MVFSEGEVTRSVGIVNRRAQPLGWQAVTGAPWLTLQPAGGIVPPGDTEALGIIARREGLASGSYQATVTVSSDDGRVELPVTLTIR